MVLLLIYILLFLVSIFGLILLGIVNRQRALEYKYRDAIRQLKVISLSRGRR